MKARCGKKRITLELGGNAAVIVADVSDDEWDYVLSRILIGGYNFAGQSCISTQRLYVHDSIYDKFVGDLTERVKKLKHGNPLHPDTQVGPMIDEKFTIKAHENIHSAVAAGGTLLAGGNKEGSVLEATLLENVPDTHEIWNQEAFAPIVIARRYTDFKDVVADVNKSDYGLQIGVFTRDLRKAFYAYENIEASDHFKVVRMKNKIGKCQGPFNLHVNVLFSPQECEDPILCEIQFYPKDVYQLQHRQHLAYELRRASSVRDLI